ncbi:STAS domain-containing protein [uncultured Victivallis sp.]|uniref:STAS domain-containing protein n=1 Tax=uncultured Victivallis sp. TaxID=354118 RepID=UPI002594154B|nr:STAS domain-containing protein [uncultured Victivallis sp.]
MDIREEKIGSSVKVMIIGRLTADCADQFKQYMQEALARGRRFVLDLSEMEYVDSTGLGAMVFVLQRISEAGGELKIASLQAKPRVVFDITKAYKIFDIYPGVEKALAALEPPQQA